MKNLENPILNFTIKEKHHFALWTKVPLEKMKQHYIKNTDEKILSKTFLTFSEFQNADLTSSLTIPFSFQIPPNVYPTLLLEKNAYVKHFLIIEIPSIEAKATKLFIIKNSQHFSKQNGLLDIPAIEKIETDKHKVFVNEGKFSCILTLPKNAFAYDEKIPFTINLDTSQLNMEIKNLILTLKLRICYSYKYDYKTDQDYHIKGENIEKLVEKKIPIDRTTKKNTITDTICFPKTSKYYPPTIFQSIENDTNPAPNLDDLHLAASCYEGIIICLYSIDLLIEMDSSFTTDEDLSMRIDFYMPNLNQENVKE